MNFKGTALPRSAGIERKIAERLGCSEAVIRAVLAVEAAGHGFLRDGRPKILFERHKFHQFTGGKHSSAFPSISSPTPGGYAGGALEYTRLETAYALAPEAALRATSWGLPQIMGFNHGLAGFESIQAMVEAFKAGEDEQLLAFATFIENVGLADELRNLEWKEFARQYNGPAHKDYDKKLISAYTRELAKANDRAADWAEIQAQLNALGFGPLVVDGFFGPKTEAALRAFQAERGLPVTGGLTPQTEEALFEGGILELTTPAPPSKAPLIVGGVALAALVALGAILVFGG